MFARFRTAGRSKSQASEGDAPDSRPRDYDKQWASKYLLDPLTAPEPSQETGPGTSHVNPYRAAAGSRPGASHLRHDDLEPGPGRMRRGSSPSALPTTSACLLQQHLHLHRYPTPPAPAASPADADLALDWSAPLHRRPLPSTDDDPLHHHHHHHLHQHLHQQLHQHQHQLLHQHQQLQQQLQLRQQLQLHQHQPHRHHHPQRRTQSPAGSASLTPPASPPPAYAQHFRSSSCSCSCSCSRTGHSCSYRNRSQSQSQSQSPSSFWSLETPDADYCAPSSYPLPLRHRLGSRPAAIATPPPPPPFALPSVDTGAILRRRSSIRERYPGDMSHRPLDMIRNDAMAADRPFRHRKRISETDTIDALDTIGGAYHHGGPYDATLLSRNLDKKSSPVAAVEQSNLEAIRATPRENIIDSLTRHVPLQGTASIPAGLPDMSGRLMQYDEGADLMREPDAPGGAYKRWDSGLQYHPDDLKGKGEPSFTIEQELGKDKQQRRRHRSSDPSGFEMQSMSQDAEASNAAAGIQRSHTTGKKLSGGLRRRFGSSRRKKDHPEDHDQ
ncbi:uncharacterized protein UV8b_01452 [Ustilaginoidea virens]|uniref:Uncharacterized protein n=1 Tax=Ustilaginoidea virens TaxID=1159556 RepID=A0A8E5MF88_USTVR|nr:uncharacterized protein UV8b_01452 [Ustilaginoidea virens]QUC17211.1 hypothetical protein UV8b_01452 [Ustilaginoidea virens]